MGPNVRFAIALAAGAFFVLGSIETQVLLAPARGVKALCPAEPLESP